MGMKEAIRYAEEMDIKMIPYELAEGTKETKAIFTELKKLTETGNTNGPVPRVAVFIGPEGGFEEEEVKQATETGILPISLGNRILRTETAGMVVLSWINYCLEVEG